MRSTPGKFGIFFVPSRYIWESFLGSAAETLCFPKNAMALRFLEPITAPMPVRPLARLTMLIMAENRTRFSPAGPICSTSILGLPSSSLSMSSTTGVVLPHRWPAARIFHLAVMNPYINRAVCTAADDQPVKSGEFDHRRQKAASLPISNPARERGLRIGIQAGLPRNWQPGWDGSEKCEDILRGERVNPGRQLFSK